MMLIITGEDHRYIEPTVYSDCCIILFTIPTSPTNAVMFCIPDYSVIYTHYIR